jgi:hypothetical protein
MSEHYHPEYDDTPLLDKRGAAIYWGFIGSAKWAVTLGHFDIQYATQMMSRFSMALQQGHLDAMKRVFGYLKMFQKGKIIMDSIYCVHFVFKITNYDDWK